MPQTPLKETQRAFGRVLRYIKDRCTVDNVDGYVIDQQNYGVGQKAIVYPEHKLLRAIGIDGSPSNVWTVRVFGKADLITLEQFACHVLPNLLRNASFDHDLKPDASLVQEGRLCYPSAFQHPVLQLDRTLYPETAPAVRTNLTLDWQPGQDAAVFRKAIAKHGLLPQRFFTPEVEGKDLIMVDTLMALASRLNVALDLASCGVRSIKIASMHYVAIGTHLFRFLLYSPAA